MRKPLLLVSTVLAALLLLAPAARADTKTVTITDGIAPGTAKVNPNPVTINEDDTVTFKNDATTPYTVCITANDAQLAYVPIGGSDTTVALAAGTLAYYLAKADCSPEATHAANGTIDVKAAPVTTTTEPATTTTSASTTTTSKSTTTTSSTTSSTSSTTSTSTTSTTVAPVAASGSGGGSNSALLLAIAALVVASLAGAAYYAYRRGQEPPYDDPEGWDSPDDWDDGPPPTQVGPTV